jgi:hypothetical protein
MPSANHSSAEWYRARRLAKPRLAAEIEQGMGRCVDCGRGIEPGTPQTHWEVGHRVSVARARAAGWEEWQIHAQENLGPSHSKASGRACNQRAGGIEGTDIQRAAKAESKRLFKW